MMSNLPDKIKDTYLSKEDSRTCGRFFKLLLRFLLLTFGGAAFIQIAGSLSLFYFYELTDLICAILYVAAVFACILIDKGKAPAASDSSPQ